MKIAICDNNEAELNRIRELLEIYACDKGQKFFIKCFTSSVELASTAEFEKYDIYFLDIIMPVMDGINLAREIRAFDRFSPVIFLTSSPEFAVESYTVKAFNYLLKPIIKEALYDTLDDIIDTFHKERNDTYIIKNNSGIHKIYLSDIMYAEALNRKVILYLSDNEQVISTDIVSVLNLINYGFVLIFGIIVSFYFAGIQWEDNKRLFILTTVLFVLFQALFYVLLGENVLFKCYPVLIHIPLILIIRYICHQNIYISFIAVMSAYLMCTPRKWFGTLAKYIFPEIPIISDVVTIVITIPLLIVVIKYISPYIIKLKEESKNIISMFFLLPLTYYILEYALTVYTNLLYTGKAVIIEFMDSFIVVLYFFLSIVTLSMSNKKNTAERENIILSAAAAQAEKEISQLTDYQKQAAIYRHDLRHHMNFIQSCLAGNNMQQALEYINEINNNLDNTRITRYCSNEAINLILSSYINKAHDADISTQISVTATDFSSYRITDLCSLLANALENAINSCIKQCDNAAPKDNKRLITIKLFEKITKYAST